MGRVTAFKSPGRSKANPREAHPGPEPPGGDPRSGKPRPAPPERRFTNRTPREWKGKNRFLRYIPGTLRPECPGSCFPIRGVRNAVFHGMFRGLPGRRLGHPGSSQQYALQLPPQQTRRLVVIPGGRYPPCARQGREKGNLPFRVTAAVSGDKLPHPRKIG